MPTLRFEIHRHLKDKRLDSALFELLTELYPGKQALSRRFVTDLVRSGRVMRNGSPAKPSALVSQYDILEVSSELFPEEDLDTLGKKAKKTKETLKESHIPLPILFENEHFLVLDKPTGLRMHGAGTRPQNTLATALVEAYPALAQVGDDPRRPGMVHRLDQETSGVLVVAKTPESFAALKACFQKRGVTKGYVALVYGHLSRLSGTVEAPIMRLSGELRRRVVDPRKTTANKHLPENVRPAVTDYRVMARYREHDLVWATPKTGRTHQIRVHLASLAHPVVGDKLYSFKPVRRGEGLFTERQMLHARSLGFTLFGQKYAFQAPLPADFRQVLQSIDETKEAGYDDEALESLLSA